MADLERMGSFVAMHEIGRRWQIWWLSFEAAGGDPEFSRRRDGINGLSIPPGLFVAKAMVVPVMGSAQRYGELVADLAFHRAGLSKSQMVGV